jgi:RNA polymerase sigma-70 factor (ECF subfamily)
MMDSATERMDGQRAGGTLNSVGGETSTGNFMVDLALLYPDLRRRAERLAGSGSAADDLLHDALERGLRNQARFRTGGSPERWMKTILLRVFIDGRRRQRRHPHVLCAQPDEFPAITEATQEYETWQRFSDEDLHQAIESLPAGFREVYHAYAVDQRTHADIARDLGLPPGTVGTRIMRARTKLRAILEARATPPRPEAPALRVLPGGAKAARPPRPRRSVDRYAAEASASVTSPRQAMG